MKNPNMLKYSNGNGAYSYTTFYDIKDLTYTEDGYKFTLVWFASDHSEHISAYYFPDNDTKCCLLYNDIKYTAADMPVLIRRIHDRNMEHILEAL